MPLVAVQGLAPVYGLAFDERSEGEPRKNLRLQPEPARPYKLNHDHMLLLSLEANVTLCCGCCRFNYLKDYSRIFYSFCCTFLGMGLSGTLWEKGICSTTVRVTTVTKPFVKQQWEDF